LVFCSVALVGPAAFERIYTPPNGLGPAYNAYSCAGCHTFPALGGSRQIAVTRPGHRDASGRFVPARNGGLLHTRFIDPAHSEPPGPLENVQGQRVTVRLLGDGYVEAIPDVAIVENARQQRATSGGKISGQHGLYHYWTGQFTTLASLQAGAGEVHHRKRQRLRLRGK